MLKRMALFLLTNIAVLATITILMRLFNVEPYLNSYGLNYKALLIYSAIVGFSGSIISLFLSKFMAKMAYGIEAIDSPRTPAEAFVFRKVRDISERAGIGMPEVGIYHSPEPNAFATGWNRNKALVAVSTGLLNGMSEDEVEAVLAHEVAHVANGDMVTLTLIQGVVNTFVVFFARIAAHVVSMALRSDREEEEGSGGSTLVYFLLSMVFQIIFGIIATPIVMAFSRWREYRADRGAAKAVGARKMISALARLQAMSGRYTDPRAPELANFKIAGQSRLLTLFSSHPSIEKRIAALQRL